MKAIATLVLKLVQRRRRGRSGSTLTISRKIRKIGGGDNLISASLGTTNPNYGAVELLGENGGKHENTRQRGVLTRMGRSKKGVDITGGSCEGVLRLLG